MRKRLHFPEIYGMKPSAQSEHITINSHDVVEVRLTKEQSKVIDEYAQAVVNDPNLPDALKARGVDRWAIGFAGQIAFYIYAKDDFKEAIKTLKRKYAPDRHDFIFKGWGIDVKTNGRPDGDLMMIPQYQWGTYHDFYVGCRLQSKNPYVIEIWGYATREELAAESWENYGYGPTKAKFLKKLHPIIDLRKLKHKKDIV